MEDEFFNLDSVVNPRMPHLPSHVILLDRWRRLALAFVCGAIASLAQPPLGWFPLLWLCLPVLVWLLDSASLGKSIRQSVFSMAIVGWTFAFGFFLLTFYWLGAAFLVEADKFAWAMPLAILVLPAGLSLFWALACAASALLWSSSPLRVMWLALFLSAAEWLRGSVLTGLPWGGFAPALAANGLMMQVLALVGPDLLTLFAVLLFSLPVFLFSDEEMRPVGRWLALLVGIGFVLQLGYGAFRLNLSPQTSQDTKVIRLVQPNIPQKEKWKFENRSWIFNRLLALTSLDSETNPTDAVDMVVWPESALPFYLIEQPAALAAIAQALPENAGLMTGALRREQSNLSGDRVYNSIYQMNKDGTILASYDKVHLVPFGEYLPKRPWLQAMGFEQLVAQKSGFASGSSRTLLKDEALGNILPLICFEVAFSSEVRSFPDGADWILNVTNDAWFGATAGPKQHLHMARMRAVETGLPLVRVANTGISAIIDGNGRILKQLDLNEEGILQANLPFKAPESFFARFGNWIFFVTWAFFAFATLNIRRKLNQT